MENVNRRHDIKLRISRINYQYRNCQQRAAVTALFNGQRSAELKEIVMKYTLYFRHILVNLGIIKLKFIFLLLF